MYPFNSYSSLFYLILLNKLYKNKKDQNFFNTYGIIITILLTISSFFWWARKNKYVQLIDVNSYSLLVFFIGFYFLYNNLKENKDKLKLFNYIGVIFSFITILYYSKNLLQYLGIILLLLSIILKFFDTFNIIDFNKYKLISGTGWFHIFSAFGIYYLL